MKYIHSNLNVLAEASKWLEVTLNPLSPCPHFAEFKPTTTHISLKSWASCVVPTKPWYLTGRKVQMFPRCLWYGNGQELKGPYLRIGLSVAPKVIPFLIPALLSLTDILGTACRRQVNADQNTSCHTSILKVKVAAASVIKFSFYSLHRVLLSCI